MGENTLANMAKGPGDVVYVAEADSGFAIVWP